MDPHGNLVLRPGRIIDGRLRLEERLGEGGAGDVWRATRLDRSSAVAVKLVSPRLHGDGRQTARLLREATLAKRIDCEHVVRVVGCVLSLEVGPYMVMEHVDGPDLFEVLARSGPLPAAHASTIIAQLCVALEAVHAAGVLHCDVKPENVVMARRNGRLCVTLIDFGIARDSGAEDAGTGARISGTPGYMSPETLAGTAGVGVQGDLWSLAVVAYQCLVGRTPFDDRAVETPPGCSGAGVFDHPSGLRADVQPALDGWFARAFARTSGERFASASEMREAFIEACSPLPLEAPASLQVLASPTACPTASGTRPRLSRARVVARDDVSQGA